MSKYLVVRADANARIGSGHLMRCLALAQAWKAHGGKAVFVTACESDALRQCILDEGFQVVLLERPYPESGDWKQTSQILRRHPGTWVVLDGYHFDSGYHRRIKEAGHPLLVIDDMAHLDHYCADIVLNQNIHAEQLQYSCEPYTRLLLGTRYVLLRSEFMAWRGWQREIPRVARKVLVTMGGSDPENVTLKVIRALEKVKVDGLEAVIVVGSSSPHYNELKTALQNSNVSIRLEKHVKNMPELMAWADVAISAGGTTCWELAFMGVPFVVITLAENQRPVAEGLDNAGCAINLGWHHNLSVSEIEDHLESLLLDQKRRMEMAECGQRIVDGKGIIRVLSHLEMQILRLRRVRQDDCRLLWQWANDPQVRNSAFSPDPIPWEKHIKWFHEKLNDPNCSIFIAEDKNGIPSGQIRFDIKGEHAEVDISVDGNKRGLGYGSLLIKQGVMKVFKTTAVKTIHAFIKPHNMSSIKSFEKAGFRYVGLETIKGQKVKHYVTRIEDVPK